MTDSPKDYFKAISFAVVCIVALFWTGFAGVVAYHTAMDKSPLTLSLDPIQIICKVRP